METLTPNILKKIILSVNTEMLSLYMNIKFVKSNDTILPHSFLVEQGIRLMLL